ncbi:hypothetical protein AeRB84_004899 [Aphanomyces euteiches]|nr:hypothetical protein AeRB84_021049 [Aphanomyces euteiches]KAH9145231.1 hypothetical protein AeRB84_010864 [Aphanomyces euteiches]KAH9147678.1 hypothetical protein AeRB84_008742 [Aphanomyces euteiches]KAH9147705.1 hypothetical protein AeRB84_008769 [Aphanomyces euteiches]KAH9152720.1 hypothetical protein AeRB84_004899 [Aphanomyces euteiches]
MVFHSFRLTDDTMAPVWAYVVLAIGIATMSSGGVWFALLVETPPLMQACWRLTLTAVLQTFGVLYELRTDPTIMGVAFQLRFIKAIPLVMTIGTALAGYFGSWGWSVAHTSLVYSLLLVCTTPLILVAVMSLCWLYRQTCRHEDHERVPLFTKQNSLPSLFEIVVCPKDAKLPTLMEAIGAVVGCLGVVALLATSNQDNSQHATLAGNVAALCGALVLVIYIEGSATCRSWMPLFVYSLAVTASAALELGVVWLLLEPSTTVWGVGPTALFGFVGDLNRFGLVFGAAFIAGFFGHACDNVAVVHVRPLVISVAVLWEPLIGGVVGVQAVRFW